MYKQINQQVSNLAAAGKRRLFFPVAAFVILLVIILPGCGAGKTTFQKSYRRLDQAEKLLADSLLKYALDHEALYTLCDTLKPVSSIMLYRLPLFSPNPAQRDSATNVLAGLQRIANQLSFGDCQFLLNPFERPDGIYKNIELYVIRKNRLQSRIREQRDFYHRLGLSEYSLPATVLAITEYENKYDRWKSYGYLFGYPAHAVDFFVEAGKRQDSTGQFVARDFFQVPVYADLSGYFTYAVPKGYQPVETDSAIYHKATITLNKYRAVREKYFSGNRKKNMAAIMKQMGW